MTVPVFVDAENVGYLWFPANTTAAVKSGRQRLLLERILEEAQRLSPPGADITLQLHWADPVEKGASPFSLAAGRVVRNVGGTWHIHARIERDVDGRNQVQKSTTDIGLAVAAVAGVTQLTDCEQVILGASDADYIPLIRWLGAQGLRVHMVHTNPQVYREVQQAIRRTGGRSRRIHETDVNDRPPEGKTPAPTGVVELAWLAQRFPRDRAHRLQLLTAIRDGVATGELDSSADLRRVVPKPIAEVVLPALVVAGPRSPLTALVEVPQGGRGLNLAAVADWLTEAEIVWAASAVAAVIGEYGEAVLATCWEALRDGWLEPPAAASAVARAAQAAFGAPWIAAARKQGFEAPADAATRHGVATDHLHHRPVLLPKKARAAFTVAQQCAGDGDADELAAAWVAVVVSLNPDLTQSQIMAVDGAVARYYLFTLDPVAAADALARISHWVPIAAAHHARALDDRRAAARKDTNDG